MRRALPFIVIAVIVAGCAARPDLDLRRVELRDAYRGYIDNVLLDGRYSRATQQALALEPAAQGDITADARLDALWRSRRLDETARLFATAELALERAQQTERKDPAAARGWYLLAAWRAYQLLYTPQGARLSPLDLRMHLAQAFLSAATGGYVMLRTGVPEQRFAASVERAGATQFAVSVDAYQLYEAGHYDEYQLAWSMAAPELRTRYTRDGVGVPLVGIRNNAHEYPIDRYYPPEGIGAPVTGVLRFRAPDAADAPVATDLALYDARRHAQICVAQRGYPLAADFTMPYAALLNRAHLSQWSLDALLDFRHGEAHRGIFMLEPYRPDKIVVLMVHGFWSSPVIWRELSNDVLGDPALRERYQVWHYLYPTGVPFWEAARRFRADLDGAVAEVAPGGVIHPLILVAHSMGGLLAKSAAVDTGTRLWDAALRVPPERLDLDARERDELRDSLIFSHRPYIGRIVFLGVPQHGAAEADSTLASFGKRLISLPTTVLQTLATRLRQGDVVSDFSAWLASRGTPSAVDSLSPQSPVTRAFAALPVDASIPFHSIIGVKENGRDGPGDGWVSYASAHLDGAASELTLPVGHSQFDQPAPLAEVYRILRLHADAELGADPSSPRPACEIAPH